MIATLARQAQEQGIPVMVVSGDRDVYQLVGDGVRVMTTSRGITDTKIYDREGVIERYGVTPELVPDLIGLKGDTSDNIPGVPGIGDKTAAQLLQQFGSLEAVLDNIDEISGPKRKQNLTEHADDARVSKQLATLHLRRRDRLDLAELMRARPQTAPGCARARRVRASRDPRAPRGGLRRAHSRPRGRGDDRASTRSRGPRPTSPTARSRSRSRRALGRLRTAQRVVTGDAADLAGLSADLGAGPLIAHDAKSLGGSGGKGLLGRRPGTLDLAHDTMVAAYLIDPARRTYDLDELAADEGLGRRARPRPRPGQLSLEAEEATPRAIPRRRPGSSGSSPPASARSSPSLGSSGC